LIKEYVAPGLLERDDLVGLAHAIRPAFLGRQLEQTLACLGVERLDLLLLEDLEIQRAEFEEAGFEKRMRAAIGWLERQADEGRIGAWGIAARCGLRAPPQALQHLDVDSIAGWACDVAGAAHHFGFVLDGGSARPTLYDATGLAGLPLGELELL
jgi:hypothetical protein